MPWSGCHQREGQIGPDCCALRVQEQTEQRGQAPTGIRRLLNRLLPATVSKFTFGAMAVQNQIWWGIVGQVWNDFVLHLAHLVSESGDFHPERGMIVSVDDLADTQLTSQKC